MELQLDDVLIACTALAFVCGWIRYAYSRLRARQSIAWVLAVYIGIIHGLHSGALGLIIGFLWCTWYANTNVGFAIAASGIVGITGMDIAGLLKALVIRALQSMLSALSAPEAKQDD